MTKETRDLGQFKEIDSGTNVKSSAAVSSKKPATGIDNGTPVKSPGTGSLAMVIRRRGMEKRGFIFTGTSICYGCKREIQWTRSPRGKAVPLTAENLEIHTKTCHQAFQSDPSMPKPQTYRRRGRC